jgi:hypothetical protein
MFRISKLLLSKFITPSRGVRPSALSTESDAKVFCYNDGHGRLDIHAAS